MAKKMGIPDKQPSKSKVFSITVDGCKAFDPNEFEKNMYNSEIKDEKIS